jgi:hypothetical protein
MAQTQEQETATPADKLILNELAKTVDPGAIPANMAECIYWAKTMAKTNLGVTESEALTRILIGRQWDMDPVSAVQNIYQIKGRYMAHYSVLLGKVKKTGIYRFKWLENSDTRAALEFFEWIGGNWESLGVSEFTLADAKKAQTQNMEKWAKVMLAARAVGIGVRLYCPDAFNGMVPYAQGEVDDDAVSGVPALSKSESIAAEMRAKAESEIIEAEIVPDAPASNGEPAKDDDPPYVPDEHAETEETENQEALL